ncbi:probable inactive ribonuclease-like protein 13 [Pteropus alecto]|uniref:Ribonuclease-like protein 13 n=1 Tax=Pteropus alecto TaxID=9402 RepID=L5K8L7_PTEAL|nr:probable inactive ribonuclease-like protein 13 [Pteropus alecto]ELK07111.1 Ribonuclease-like protein 13 [Pteropus alecto]
MAPAAAWLLLLQLSLEPALVMNIGLQMAIRNFRILNINYPKVKYPVDFQGYCNGMMSYVRGKKQDWYCPETHYVIHAPWRAIQKLCKHCENFCDNYNQYCTVTKDSLPITICSRITKQPPPSCSYNGTLTNQRIYLLCSQKYEGQPIDIIGTY